jgi:hypothetical protein
METIQKITQTGLLATLRDGGALGRELAAGPRSKLLIVTKAQFSAHALGVAFRHHGGGHLHISHNPTGTDLFFCPDLRDPPGAIARGWREMFLSVVRIENPDTRHLHPHWADLAMLEWADVPEVAALKAAA